MEKIPSETDSLLLADQGEKNKSRVTYDFLLLVSAAVVIGAVAVGMFMMVLP